MKKFDSCSAYKQEKFSEAFDRLKNLLKEREPHYIKGESKAFQNGFWDAYHNRIKGGKGRDKEFPNAYYAGYWNGRIPEK